MAKVPPSVTLSLARRGRFESVDLPGAQVFVQERSGEEHRVPLGLEPVLVGTSDDCHVRLSDAGVSREHCRLTLTPQGVLLEDMGSKNGTFIEHVPVVKALLSVGVQVHLGRSRLRVTAQGKAERVPLSDKPHFGEAIGLSLLMRALFARLERAAASDAHVVLLGESGTGKEVLARALHHASPRKAGPFIVMDCAAVAPSLVESELFGHLKGAFTGADQKRTGLLEAAHAGTLFMDELGELPLELQPKLLRAVETKQVRPLGSDDYRPADCRVICATHRDLKARVERGEFRKDLYFRLAVVEATVPPLRERKEDIPMLVERFLAQCTPPLKLSDLPPRTVEQLQAHDWPGNVRELRNHVARLALVPELGEELVRATAPKRTSALVRMSLRDARDAAMEEFERGYLTAQLQANEGNVSRAAEAMGVSRQFAHRLLARHGIRGGRG